MKNVALVAILVLAVAHAGCTKPADLRICTDPTTTSSVARGSAVTWSRDIGPIVQGRCQRCHQSGGIAPFPLTSYAEAQPRLEAMKEDVLERRMPPWLPAHCCNAFRDDTALTPEQIAAVASWVDQGAPEGDPNLPGAPLPSLGGLSRVDVRVEMPEPYTPAAAGGRFDDFRCFVLDWPLGDPVFITGLNPVPGTRGIVHHLIIGVADGDDAKRASELTAQDGRPGYPCEGGFGELHVSEILGGSLVGGDFPEGIGTRIEPHSKIILNVHYSLAITSAASDRTAIEFKIESLSIPLRRTRSIVAANPAWIVGDAFYIPAGKSDVAYAYQFDPRLFTGGKPALLLGITPHMHYFGKQLTAAIIKGDDRQTCLIEIADWRFGWEQPYWFADPIRLDVGDQVQVRCTFDNTDERQPIRDGVREKPRDIAWGIDNQDMCAAFIAFTPLEDSK
jgi:copper type II ascorbate-dependent monooxygenase-like protein